MIYTNASEMKTIVLKELSTNQVLITIQTPILPRIGNLMIVNNRQYTVRHVISIPDNSAVDVYLELYKPLLKH